MSSGQTRAPNLVDGVFTPTNFCIKFLSLIEKTERNGVRVFNLCRSPKNLGGTHGNRSVFFLINIAFVLIRVECS
jgi:hypothetical protein